LNPKSSLVRRLNKAVIECKDCIDYESFELKKEEDKENKSKDKSKDNKKDKSNPK
jgi:hypothetical protein